MDSCQKLKQSNKLKNIYGIKKSRITSFQQQNIKMKEKQTNPAL